MASDKEKAKEDKPKKSKLKLIIIGILVLIIGGGGYFGYSKYKQGKKEKPEKVVKASVICPLKSFVVNLFDKRGIGKRYLKITMQLEVGKEKDKLKVEKNMPKLRDTILILLSSLTLKDINTMAGKIELKHAILSRVNQVLSEKIANGIYFTEFVVQ